MWRFPPKVLHQQRASSHYIGPPTGDNFHHIDMMSTPRHKPLVRANEYVAYREDLFASVNLLVRMVRP